jgi:hypothetical protein
MKIILMITVTTLFMWGCDFERHSCGDPNRVTVAYHDLGESP